MKYFKYIISKLGLRLSAHMGNLRFKSKLISLCLCNTDVSRDIYIKSVKVNDEINKISSLLKSKPGALVDKIKKIQNNTKELERAICQIKKT